MTDFDRLVRSFREEGGAFSEALFRALQRRNFNTNALLVEEVVSVELKKALEARDLGRALELFEALAMIEVPWSRLCFQYYKPVIHLSTSAVPCGLEDLFPAVTWNRPYKGAQNMRHLGRLLQIFSRVGEYDPQGRSILTHYCNALGLLGTGAWKDVLERLAQEQGVEEIGKNGDVKRFDGPLPFKLPYFEGCLCGGTEKCFWCTHLPDNCHRCMRSGVCAYCKEESHA